MKNILLVRCAMIINIIIPSIAISSEKTGVTYIIQKAYADFTLPIMLHKDDKALCDYVDAMFKGRFNQIKKFINGKNITLDGMVAAACALCTTKSQDKKGYIDQDLSKDFLKAQLFCCKKYSSDYRMPLYLIAHRFVFNNYEHIRDNFKKNIQIFWPIVATIYQKYNAQNTLTLAPKDISSLPVTMYPANIQLFSCALRNYPESHNVYLSYAKTYLIAQSHEKLALFATLFILPVLLYTPSSIELIHGLRRSFGDKRCLIFHTLVKAVVKETSITKILCDIQKIVNGPHVVAGKEPDLFWLKEELLKLPAIDHFRAKMPIMYKNQQISCLTDIKLEYK